VATRQGARDMVDWLRENRHEASVEAREVFFAARRPHHPLFGVNRRCAA
jgi:hypothetical protein